MADDYINMKSKVVADRKKKSRLVFTRFFQKTIAL